MRSTILGLSLLAILAPLASFTAGCSAAPPESAAASSSSPLRAARPGDTVYDVSISQIQETSIFHSSPTTQSRPYDDDYVYLGVAGAVPNGAGGDLAYVGTYDDGRNEYGQVHSGATVASDPSRFVVRGLPIYATDRVAIAFSVDSRTSDTVAKAFASAHPNEVRLMNDESEELATNTFFAYPYPPGPTDPFPLWTPRQDGFPKPFTNVGSACDGYVAKGVFMMDTATIVGALSQDGQSTTFPWEADSDSIACFADQNAQYTAGGVGWDNAKAHTKVTFKVTRRDLPLPVVGPPCTPELRPQNGAPDSAWAGTWRDKSYGGRSLVTTNIAVEAPNVLYATTDLASPMCSVHATANAWKTITSTYVSPTFSSDQYESLCSVRAPFPFAIADAPPATRPGQTPETLRFYPTVDELPLSNRTELSLYREACQGWTGPYHVRYMRRDAYGTPTTDVMLDLSTSPR